jgi:hypothetical protein
MISEMFKVALQLEEPWKLTHVEFDDMDQAWHLFIDFARGATFAVPYAGSLVKHMTPRRRPGDTWTSGIGKHICTPECHE